MMFYFSVCLSVITTFLQSNFAQVWSEQSDTNVFCGLQIIHLNFCASVGSEQYLQKKCLAALSPYTTLSCKAPEQRWSPLQSRHGSQMESHSLPLNALADLCAPVWSRSFHPTLTNHAYCIREYWNIAPVAPRPDKYEHLTKYSSWEKDSNVRDVAVGLMCSVHRDSICSQTVHTI